MSIVSHVPINSRGRSNQKILSGGCIASGTPSLIQLELGTRSTKRVLLASFTQPVEGGPVAQVFCLTIHSLRYRLIVPLLLL